MHLATVHKEGLAFVKRWKNDEMLRTVLGKVMAEQGVQSLTVLGVPGHPSQSLASLEQP